MFEKALRLGLRFPFKGESSVEDIWALSVEELDSIYKRLNSQAKQLEEESLLGKKTKADDELSLKIEIIKHIVEVKQQEATVKENAAKKRIERQKILKLLSEKQDEALRSKSIEDLEKLLDEDDELSLGA